MPDLTIKEILLKSSEYLRNKGVDNSRHDSELILSHFLGISRMSLYLEFETIVAKEKTDVVRQAVVERGKRKPLQYILGNVYFMDCLIEVNERVLIPRPETEFMVDLLMSLLPLRGRADGNASLPFHILDLCTGSGAIAIALKKKLRDATVYASDICEKALQVAKNNAAKNNCEINFVQSDLFTCFRQTTPNKEKTIFDLIVSNPPYISEADYSKLAPEIFFEPQIALVAENEGLCFYDKIIKQANEFLKEEGVLYLEIGDQQAEITKKMAEENQYNEIEVFKDLNDRNRIIRMKK